jgi:hypothetical protein
MTMRGQRTPLFCTIFAALFALSACALGYQAPTPILDADLQDAVRPALSIHPTRPPNPIATASAITPDGSVWFAFDEFDGLGGQSPYSQNRGLYRSKDNVISHVEITQTIRVLKIGPDGSLYVGTGCGVLRHKAGQWDTLAEPDCGRSSFKNPFFTFDIAFATNGEVWVGGIHALARYDGKAWKEYDLNARRLLVAPDGSVWADGWDGQADSNCCFTHLTGDTWVTYTHSDALPVASDLLMRINELRQ